MDPLDRVRELTPNLPSVPRLGNFKRDIINSSDVAYEVKGGYVMSECLFNTEHIAIARGIIQKGMEFPEHDHAEKEYTLIFKGSIEITSEGSTGILRSGDFFVTDPNIPHSAVALEYTEYIAITIPASKDYPKNDTTK